MAKVGAAPADGCELKRERLLDMEKTQMMMAPGIATLTFFRGDAAQAAEVLRETEARR
jgi:hypothetical protein